MTEQTLQERNALGGRTPPIPSGRLTIEVAADCARLSFRVDPGSREAAARLFGCELPGRIGGLSAAGARVAARLGPDEWLLMAPFAEGPTIAARFGSDLKEPHSLVDVSHREVGIEVRGAAAALALAAGCALDLEARPSPSATRTLFDKAQVILLKWAPDHYRIEVWPSFADHVWLLLKAAAREIALDI